MNQRSALLTAVGVAGAIAAVVGFFLVAQESRDAAQTRLLVDIGLLVVLAGAVVAMTRPPAGTTDEVIDAMRALGRGKRDVRLEPERYGELHDIVRTYNELAAALSEFDDPNLGHVKSRPRRAPAPDFSGGPGLGEVRVLTPDSEPPQADSEPPQLDSEPPQADSEPPQADSEPPQADSEPPQTDSEPPQTDSEPPQADSEPPQTDSEPTAEEIAAGRETSPARPAARRAASSNDTSVDRSPPAMDSGEEEELEPAPLPPLDLRGLFQEFVEAKRAHDEDTTDLEFDSFEDTIKSESARLQDAHQCRAVRFEVRVQDGEVSLLPRLLR